MKKLLPINKNLPLKIGDKNLEITNRILNKASEEDWYGKGIKNEKINLDFAIYCYDKSLLNQPNNWQTYFRLFLCLIEQNQINEAIENFDNGLSILLSNDELVDWDYTIQNFNLNRDEINDIINKLENSAQENIYKLIGQLKCFLEDWESSIKDFKNILSFKYKNEYFYFFKGLANYKFDNLDEAIRAFEFSIEIHPDFSISLYFLALCYQKNKNHTKANEIFDLAKKPNNKITIESYSITIQDFSFLKDISEKHPELTLNIISKYHPININTIKFFNSGLGSVSGTGDYIESPSFTNIYSNENIIWTEELLRFYCVERDFIWRSYYWDWNLALKIEDYKWNKENILKEEEKATDGYSGGGKSVLYRVLMHINTEDPDVYKFIIKEYFENLNKWNSVDHALKFAKLIPWSIELIDSIKDEIYWSLLCANESIKWDDKLISRFFKYIKWEELSYNPSIIWSEDLLIKYENHWNWRGLSLKSKLPSSISFIEKYKEKWDWDMLSLNENLFWSEELINKYKGHRNSSTLRVAKECWQDYGSNGVFIIDGVEVLPNQLMQMHKYSCSWDWHGLCKNPKINWTLSLLKKYVEYIDWKAIDDNISFNWTSDIIYNFKNNLDVDLITKSKKFPWTLETIGYFKSKFSKQNWSSISSNIGENCSVEILSKYSQFVSWNVLSTNNVTPWSPEIIKKYKNLFNWQKLSNIENTNFPWTLELIEEFKDELDWIGPDRNLEKFRHNNDNGLSGNELLPWTNELIEKFKDKWNWGVQGSQGGSWNRNEYKKNISQIQNIPWCEKLIEKYEDYWFFKDLSKNEAIPWTINLLKKYKDKWDYYYLGKNKSVYVKIFSKLSEEQVNELLEIAVKSQEKIDAKKLEKKNSYF